MSRNLLLTSSWLAVSLLLSASARAADEPAQNAPAEYYPQGHTPADAKSMMLMKDQSKDMTPRKLGEAPPHDASTDGQEYYPQGHTPADAKSMARMKDKAMPTRKTGSAVAATDQPCREYSTMGHSPSDAKSMAQMKDKHAPQTRKVGDCDEAAGSAENK